MGSTDNFGKLSYNLIPLPFLFPPGRVAAGAIGEVADPLLPVLAFNFSGGVLVAAVAGIGLQAVRMAGAAGAYPALAVVQGERVRAIVTGRAPGVWGVAGLTI
jgi:hypothetical protein